MFLTLTEWVLVVTCIYRVDAGFVVRTYEDPQPSELVCKRKVHALEKDLLDRVLSDLGNPHLTSYSVECEPREEKSFPSADMIPGSEQ